MRPAPLPKTLALLFGVLALLLSGCANADVVEIRDWTVEIDGKTEPVVLPTHLDALPKRPTRYTLRTQIALPAAYRGEELHFSIPSLPAVTELRAIAPGASAGAVGADASRDVIRSDDGIERPYRGRSAHVWTLPASLTRGESLSLELAVDHTWTQSAWIDSVPRLSHGRDTPFELRREVTELGNTIAIGTLLPTGFSYLVLYLLDRRRRGNVWLSIQTLTGSFLPLFAVGVTQAWFGTGECWLLGATQVIAPYAGIRFTYATFGRGAPPRFLGWIAIGGIAASFVLGSPFQSLALSYIVVGLIVTFHAFHLLTLGRLARRTPAPPNARLLFVGWAVIAVAASLEGPVWIGLGAPIGGIRLGSWGLITISLLQSIALVRDYASSIRRTERLNHDLKDQVTSLEARQHEIELLNDELRRQVAERSEMLSSTLSRVSYIAPAPKLRAGDVVDDRWQVGRALGTGGMGSVFEVSRLRDGRLFALKVMTGEQAPLRMARFAREAQLGARLAHPNVVGIVDMGVSPHGFLYLVMELVRGHSLAAYEERYGDLGWALPVLAQVSGGLAAVHAGGVVHRDLKPSNILVETETGIVRITDFGISRQTGVTEDEPVTAEEATIAPVESEEVTIAPDRPANHALLADVADFAHFADAPGSRERASGAAESRRLELTATGCVIGTPAWSAPELACGFAAGPEADVYGLALLAVLLCTGTRPQNAQEAARLLQGRVSPDLAALLVRALAPEPRVRPTALLLANAFRTEEKRLFPAERAS